MEPDRNDRHFRWLGASRTDEASPFVWTDGTDFGSGYQNFADGEPNNFGGVEMCLQQGQRDVAVTADIPYKWNDADCTYTRRYICKLCCP